MTIKIKEEIISRGAAENAENTEELNARPDLTPSPSPDLTPDPSPLGEGRRQPIRCFEGEAKPHEAFWAFRNTAEGDEVELELYGYISEYSWWEDDITPQMFKDDLWKYGNGNPITIRLNSYGGDVIAASLMHAIIRDYPGRVTVQIDGVAASAATVVAVAGDVIRMREAAYFMIHDPMAVFFLASLNIEELKRMTASLEAVKEGIVNVYETKTGLSRARLAKMMGDETWMDAKKAVDLGFVDEVMTSESKNFAIPEGAAMVNRLRSFVNVPANLLDAVTKPPATISEPVIGPAEDARMERLRAEAKILRRSE